MSALGMHPWDSQHLLKARYGTLPALCHALRDRAGTALEAEIATSKTSNRVACQLKLGRWKVAEMQIDFCALGKNKGDKHECSPQVGSSDPGRLLTEKSTPALQHCNKQKLVGRCCCLVTMFSAAVSSGLKLLLGAYSVNAVHS